MDVQIINNHFDLIIHGFSGIATNKDYIGTAFKLSGRMWEIAKANKLKNKGKIFGFMKTMTKFLLVLNLKV